MSVNISSPVLTKVFSALTEFLDSKYRKQSEMFYSVKSFSIQPACEMVDNFLSAIYSVKFTTNFSKEKKSENHDLIFKSQLVDHTSKGEDLSKYFWNVVFTKEMMVYEEILSRLHQLAQTGGFSPNFALAPKMHHYYSEGEEYSCILLDNLISMGYYIPQTDSQQSLSLDECKIIMRNIARLHALSLVLESRDEVPLPSKYEICTTELFFSEGLEAVLRSYVQNSYLGFVQLVEKFRPDLVQTMSQLNDDEIVWTRLCDAVKAGKSSFSCFCHGDVRLNNIFLERTPGHGERGEESEYYECETESSQMEAGEPTMRFIDFQLTRYASPLTDLQYALNVATTREFREKHLSSALETYYNEFQCVLARFPDARLGLPPAVQAWTLAKLKEEYEAFNLYGLLIAIVLLPVILLRPGDIDKSVSQMTKDEREKFFHRDRRTLVFKVGSANETLRNRLFELCDEMVLKNVI